MSILDALIEQELTLPPVLSSGAARREIWICRRTDGASIPGQTPFGTGSQDDPYDGSTADKFDVIMDTRVPAGATIRLGTGIFETRGGVLSPVRGWFAKSGRIIGSGMYQTTLKLVDFSTRGESCRIITGSGNVDGLEVSDLTLDCNIAGQAATSPDLYARVCVTGIGVQGSNIIVRRVRCINWGTQTPLSEWNYPAAVSTWECFPIYVVAYDVNSVNNVVEKCVVEDGGKNNARETTLVTCSSKNGVIRNGLIVGNTPAQWAAITTNRRMAELTRDVENALL
jgi:hypothetical protein